MVALTMLLAATGASTEPHVPFELYGGHIYVSAFVDGQGPYLFGFDTGASGMGRIDDSLVASLSLPKIGEKANSDGVKTVTNDSVAVQSLMLGTLEKRGLQLIARDYDHGRQDHAIAGIIGRDFFADRVVRIDYPHRRISFSNVALKDSDPGVVGYSGSFVVPVCFTSGCYPGKLDTGSSRGIVVPEDLVPKIAATAPKAIGEAARTNSVAKLYEMTLTEPVRVARVDAPRQKILYAEPSDTVINVGSDFLKNYVLIIDQQHKLLKIEKPTL